MRENTDKLKKRLVELEQKEKLWQEQSKALATASANSAILMTVLEEKNEALEKTKKALASANVNAATLMADLEEKNEALEKAKNVIEKAKRYIDNIINSMIDTLIVVDSYGKIKTINETTSDILGYKEEELIGKTVGMILAEEEEEEEEEEEHFKGTNLEKLIKAGELRDYEITYRTKDRRKIPMLMSGAVLKEIDCPKKEPVDECSTFRGRGKHCEKILGIVCVARDMRYIKQLQQQLIQSEKMAAVGILGGGVAHELNNPLMGIGMMIECVNDELEEGDKNRERLEEVLGEVKRCSKIVTDLLSFSRPQTKGSSWEDCNKIIDKTLAIIGYQFDKINVKIIKNYGKDIPKVLVNPNQIQQVFLNIITNAIDSMEDSGKKELVIEIRFQKEFIETEFRDTGCGIPEEKLARIFDPFFTTKEVGKGTGLGLSVVKNIIEAHRSEIEITSNVGVGTKVVVRIPLDNRAVKRR